MEENSKIGKGILAWLEEQKQVVTFDATMPTWKELMDGFFPPKPPTTPKMPKRVPKRKK
jgi:hypothetical protein